MKFIINEQALNKANQSYADALLPMLKAAGLGTGEIKNIEQMFKQAEEEKSFKNWSVVRQNGDVILEIDDEMMFKQKRVVVKIVSFVIQVVSVFHIFRLELTDEIKSVTKWLEEKR